MRVIEPHMLRHLQKSKPKSLQQKRRQALVVVVLLSGAVWGALSVYSPQTLPDVLSVRSQNDPRVQAPEQPTKLRYMSGNDFQQLYESLTMPNTQPITLSPVITGDKAADARIRTIAESRGYKLRYVPKFPIIKTDEPKLPAEDLLQPKAYDAWQQLKSAAHTARIPLTFSSGYRSIDLQRQMFLTRMQAEGVWPALVPGGQADATIVRILSTAAIPGYSRHHTGYAVDLTCNDGTGRAFERTACFEWLKADNYKNAKKFGWMPSYPADAAGQGPEPEPWEYVWVGVAALSEPI